MVIFGLINSGREDWKNKSEVEHTGNVSLSVLVENMLNSIEQRLQVPMIDVTPTPAVSAEDFEKVEDQSKPRDEALTGKHAEA